MNFHHKHIKFLCAALTASMLLTGCNIALPDSFDADTTSTLPDAAEDSASAASGGITNVSNLSISADAPYSIDPTTLFTERDLGTDYTVNTEITLNGDSASASGDGVTIDGTTITITAEGIYRVTGTLKDGCIVVNAPDAKVQIVLDNADLTSSSGSAVYVADAKKVFLTLAAGSANVLTDASRYADTADGAPDAAVYSTASLTVNGTGSLSVNGNYNEGITSKDDLVITGGTLCVMTVGNGLKGKDYVAIADGEITIKAGGDGIKSSNATDAGMGFVFICGGNFHITAEGDGIQAETELVTEGGTFDITSGGGTANAPAHTDDFGMGGGMPGGNMGGFGKRGNWSQDGTTDANTDQNFRGNTNQDAQPATEGTSETNGNAVRTANTTEQPSAPAGEMPSEPNADAQPAAPADGTMPSEPNADAQPAVPADGTMPQQPDGNQPPSNTTTTTETDASSDTVSIKGMKAGTLLYVGGTSDIQIHAADDALHSNGSLYLAGGTLSIAAGSKGVHADTAIEISGGSLTVSESYEGIEAAHITVSGGDVNITSSDDGFNASDGSSQGAMGGAVDASLTISGGNVYVNANGDGLDSNGELLVSGGTVYVDGPTNSGNGALDSNSSLTCTGGLLVAVGASGMAEYPSGTQETIVLTTTGSQSANTEVVVTDASGNTVLTFTPAKTWNSFIVSSPDLASGKTYTFTLNGEDAGSVTLDDTVGFIGEAGGMMGGGMMGGRGGMGGNFQRGDFDPENLPDDFDPSQFGDGNFDPANLPDDFDPSQMQPPTNADGSTDFPQGGGRQMMPQDGTTAQTQRHIALDVSGKELTET